MYGHIQLSLLLPRCRQVLHLPHCRIPSKEQLSTLRLRSWASILILTRTQTHKPVLAHRVHRRTYLSARLNKQRRGLEAACSPQSAIPDPQPQLERSKAAAGSLRASRRRIRVAFSVCVGAKARSVMRHLICQVRKCNVLLYRHILTRGPPMHDLLPRTTTMSSCALR